MRILDRHIVREFFPMLVLCLTVFMSIFVVIDLFGHLDELLRRQIAWLAMKNYYLTLAPLMFVQATPVALLLASLFVLGNLNRRNELLAMQTSGLGLGRILRPLLICAGLLCLVVFLVNDRIVPSTIDNAQDLKVSTFNIDSTDTPQLFKNVTLYGEGHRLFHVNLYDQQHQTLKDITILQHDRKLQLISKTIAASAIWEDPGWRFLNGWIFWLDHQGHVVGEPEAFQERIMNLSERPEDFLHGHSDPEFMSIRELHAHIHRLAGVEDRTLQRMRVELYHKTALPFSGLMILLAGIPQVLRLRRGGALAGIGSSILLGLLFYAILAFSLAMGKGGLLPAVISAWLPNVLYGGLGSWKLLRIANMPQ